MIDIAKDISDKKDIRLGNIIVSKGDSRSGKVVAYNYKKETTRSFELQSFLDRIPELLKNTFSKLEFLFLDQDSKIAGYVSETTARNSCFLDFDYPELLTNNLYKYNYIYFNSSNKYIKNTIKPDLFSRGFGKVCLYISVLLLLAIKL